MTQHAGRPGGVARRRFRTRYVWWVVACFWAFVGLLTAALALNPSAPVAGRVAGAVLTGGVAVVLVCGWRAGVEVDDRGVTVRRYRGTSRTVGWADVADFELPPNGNGGVYIAVRLRSGERLVTQGLVGTSPTSARALRTCAELAARRPGTADGAGAPAS